MSSNEYVLTMARYNLWQNESLVNSASGISDIERVKDRGAFFKSIQQTFSHILWGDKIWMSRFASTEPPVGDISSSVNLTENWEEFCIARFEFDQIILKWAHNVSPDWFEGELSWFSMAIGKEVVMPKKTLVIQLFNHQTHHRGQIHAMLTAAGARPEDTDVPFMPSRFLNS